MIPLKRVRTAKAIHKNFYGAKRVAANLKLLNEKRAGNLEAGVKKKWDSSFWGEAREQLLKETKDKCAYCETPTRIVSYGDIEHFRPKSVYWWLAYSYENYLPSCTSCNQEYKKDSFNLEDTTKQLTGVPVLNTMTDAQLAALAPTLTVDPLRDAEGMPLADFKKAIEAETALLINPYFQDPTIYLAYKPILENRELMVVPTEPKYAPVIKACEDLFGINRKRLLDHRFEWYCYYVTLRYTVAELAPGTIARKMNDATLAKLARPKSQWAGMVRYFDQIPLANLPWDPELLVLEDDDEDEDA